MFKINKITKLNLGVYQNFTWNQAKIDEFQKFNAIYGWNGSGKTTVSRILGVLESGSLHTLDVDEDFAVSVETTDQTVDLSKDSVPEADNRIRIFNEDFVETNLQWTNTSAEPILIVGKEKIDQQQQLIDEKKEREKQEGKLKICNTKIDGLEKEKEKILNKSRNEIIKELATFPDITPKSGRAKEYRTYNVRDVTNLLTNTKVLFGVLTDEEKVTKKDALNDKTEKPKVDDYVADFVWISTFFERAKRVADTNLTSVVKDSLEGEVKDNEDLRDWLQTGHTLHDFDQLPVTCKFCKNEISGERIKDLESYFDEALKDLMDNIQTCLSDVDEKTLPLPAASEDFYKEYQQEYATATKDFFLEKAKLDKEITSIKQQIETKKKYPFSKISVSEKALPECISSLESSIEKLNEIIKKHNQRTDDFSTKRQEVAHQLELAIVGESKNDFDENRSTLATSRDEKTELLRVIETHKRKEHELEQSLKDHGAGAVEFNKLLKSFLGREEITFTATDTGYKISRKGRPARNLSEGERSAIALVFFLTKLKESNFDKENCVIVIDDPISSFDSQHIYQAFAFIKAHIKELNPSQFFLLTHNFQFYRQFRNWFNHEHSHEKNSAKLYIVKCKSSQGIGRFAVIENLDPLLREHSSEYTFLFKLVKERAELVDDPSLSKDYIFPNILRKLLENYLSIKVPLEGVNLHKKFENLLEDYPGYKITSISKNRIESYCQDNSHPLYQESPMDFDERLLGELPDACQDVIALIRETDQKHFTHLVNQMKQEDNS